MISWPSLLDGFAPKRAVSVNATPAGIEVFSAVKRSWIRLGEDLAIVWELCDGTRSLLDIADELQAAGYDSTNSVRDAVGAVEFLFFRGLVSFPEFSPCGIIPAPRWEYLAAPDEVQRDTATLLSYLAARNPAIGIRGFPAVVELAPGNLVESVRLVRGYGPTRGTEPAPFDHPNLAAAVELLKKWDVGYRQFVAVLRGVEPRLIASPPGGRTGYSMCDSDEGTRLLQTMWTTVDDPIAIAENFVHELAHQKLFALGVYKETSLGIIANDPQERFESAVRAVPRPMQAILHATYAYCYVAQLDWKLLDAREVDSGFMSRRLKQNQQRVRMGLATLLESAKVDSCGAAFIDGVKSWADMLLSPP